MESISRPGRSTVAAPRGCALLLISTLGFALAGCPEPGARSPARERVREQAPKKTSPAMPQAGGVEAERIKADPVAALKELQQRTEALSQYQLTFYRQERAGIVPKLGPLEEIRASYRKQPYSVKFAWDDPNSEYKESIYVAGQNNNKLVVLMRKGILGLPPRPLYLNTMDPVQWGKSKNPITDFGLAEIARRTLAPFEDPDIVKVMTIKYQGVISVDVIDRQVHHLLIERPVMKDIRYTRQDFYIDAATLLPAGTDLYLPNGDLDVRYRYTDVNTQVQLTDADFRLSSIRK